jgi:hypothetical protein
MALDGCERPKRGGSTPVAILLLGNHHQRLQQKEAGSSGYGYQAVMAWM